MKKIKTVFGFDMETDIGSWTSGYEGMQHGTPVILDILKKHDIKATFFFTADAAEKNANIVKLVKDAGHEIGCHTLFHETIGDPLFEIPGMIPLLPEEVEHRIEVCTQRVEKIAGVHPTSWRCPRLWGSTTVVNALERLGYTSDATYPMYFYRERFAPYHPSAEDWAKVGDMKLLEIPNFADMVMESSDPGLERDRDQWPLFRTESAEALYERIVKYEKFAEEKGVPAVLCFYMHPWEFHKMPEGLLHYGEGAVLPDPFIIKNCGEYAAEQFDVLIQKLKDFGSEFSTAGEITI
jgi:peptidoglycan/xylan/chitin deacetylase (PgdA/CDA1 family)